MGFRRVSLELDGMRMVAIKGGKSTLASVPGLLAVLLTADLFAQPAETTPSNGKTIEVRAAEIAPAIDGIVESTLGSSRLCV